MKLITTFPLEHYDIPTLQQRGRLGAFGSEEYVEEAAEQLVAMPCRTAPPPVVERVGGLQVDSKPPWSAACQIGLGFGETNTAQLLSLRMQKASSGARLGRR